MARSGVDNQAKSVAEESRSNRFLVIAAYFGAWPPWIRLFMLSCERNSKISWLILSDQDYHFPLPNNVEIRLSSWNALKEHASDVLGTSVNAAAPYGICNLRPMFGVIFQEDLKGYEYFGWCDIDVIWGDILSIYNEDVLRSNVISSDGAITSGHFLLVRNEPWLRDAYLLIEGWREVLALYENCEWKDSLDEAKLSTIFSPNLLIRELPRAEKIPHRYFSQNFFKQQYATPFTPQRWHDGQLDHPEIWFWRNGRIFNERDRERQFLYLHLMNFRMQRWVNTALYASSPTWDVLGKSAHFVFDQHKIEYRISRQGIWPV